MIKDKEDISVPICVDLDGALLSTDMLYESLILLIKKNPLFVFILPFWLLKGKGWLKHKLYQYVQPNEKSLPYRRELIEYLKVQKAQGRKLILTTATIRPLAEKAAAYVGIFDEVIASEMKLDGKVYNLFGEDKRKELVGRFGEKGFDYAGDSAADLNVWRSARKAIIVEAEKKVIKQAGKIAEIEKVFKTDNSNLRLIIKQIRVYQWTKNFLILLPILMAHKLGDDGAYLKLFFAFLSFSLAASAVYLANDMYDLESDRAHPRKRARPFASGALSLKFGILAAPALFVVSVVLSALFEPVGFTVSLFVYILVTSAYSALLKKIAIIDILILSFLYTLRLIAGGLSVDVALSQWLLGFSLFVFLSLAIVKRYTELKVMLSENRTSAAGRGYTTDDIHLLGSVGPSAGLLSVLIFSMYVNSIDVSALYRNPQYLWLVTPFLLFGILRIWLLAHRGKMHDDPIVAMAKDPASWLIGAIIAIIVLGAAL